MLVEKTKRLTLKLKTPRHHLEFLKNKGALEPFVSVNLTGDNVCSKWLLQDTAKKEIKDLE